MGSYMFPNKEFQLYNITYTPLEILNACVLCKCALCKLFGTTMLAMSFKSNVYSRLLPEKKNKQRLEQLIKNTICAVSTRG